MFYFCILPTITQFYLLINNKYYGFSLLRVIINFHALGAWHMYSLFLFAGDLNFMNINEIDESI